MPKPAKKKKKFISKKNATTYRLVTGLRNDDGIWETPEQIEARKEEQKNYGIFYDDEYNYMNHLRSLTEEATLVKINPSADYNETQSSYGGSVRFREFFSTDETKEEKIDEDILAALEDAPEVKLKDGDVADDEIIVNEEESFLPDDFINQAGGAIPRKDTEEIDYDSDRDFSSDGEDEGSDFDFEDSQEEVEDDFENYQGQPSRTRGNTQDDIIEAQTALILKNFEEGLGFNCGAPDNAEELTKTDNYEGLKLVLKHDKFKAGQVSFAEVLDDHADRPSIDTAKYGNDDEKKEYEWKEMPPSKPKYDCVSILSLNSNTRNLPRDIIPPRTENKRSHKSSTSESEHPPGMSLRQLEEEIRKNRQADKASTFRPKDETLDERKTRKKAVKDERKERRMEKKANKTVFTIEKHRMHAETAALAKSGKGIKMS